MMLKLLLSVAMVALPASALKIAQVQMPEDLGFNTTGMEYDEDCMDRFSYKCWKKGGHSTGGQDGAIMKYYGEIGCTTYTSSWTVTGLKELGTMGAFPAEYGLKPAATQALGTALKATGFDNQNVAGKYFIIKCAETSMTVKLSTTSAITDFSTNESNEAADGFASLAGYAGGWTCAAVNAKGLKMNFKTAACR